MPGIRVVSRYKLNPTTGKLAVNIIVSHFLFISIVEINAEKEKCKRGDIFQPMI